MGFPVPVIVAALNEMSSSSRVALKVKRRVLHTSKRVVFFMKLSAGVVCLLNYRAKLFIWIKEDATARSEVSISFFQRLKNPEEISLKDIMLSLPPSRTVTTKLSFFLELARMAQTLMSFLVAVIVSRKFPRAAWSSNDSLSIQLTSRKTNKGPPICASCVTLLSWFAAGLSNSGVPTIWCRLNSNLPSMSMISHSNKMTTAPSCWAWNQLLKAALTAGI